VRDTEVSREAWNAKCRPAT